MENKTKNKIKVIIFDNEWVIVKNNWYNVAEYIFSVYKSLSQLYGLFLYFCTNSSNSFRFHLNEWGNIREDVRQPRGESYFHLDKKGNIVQEPVNDDYQEPVGIFNKVRNSQLDLVSRMGKLYKFDDLLRKRFPKKISELEAIIGREIKKSLQIPTAKDKSNLLADYSKGKFSSDEFWEAFLDHYDIESNEFNRLILSKAICELITDSDPDAIDTIRRLKKQGYRILMLSNSTPEINKGNRERHSYFDLFDKCYFSFDIGYRKPERGAYEYLLKDQGLKSEDCLFIDDKEENLNTAREIGMKTLKHKIGDRTKLSKKLEVLIRYKDK